MDGRNDLVGEFAAAFDAAEPPELDLGPRDAPVVVSLAHDEALRLPHFLDHHRALGVARFLVVDNASDDGTSELLDAQPDVVRLPSARPYRDFARVWRRLVADLWCEGRWVLFPDIDELFVHPGWPRAPLGPLLRHWEAEGREAVFAPMVDMYPDRPLREVSYAPGGSFLEACPMFDSDGYRMMVRKEEEARELSPPVLFRGGARERLFFAPRERPATALDRLLLRAVFSPRRPMRRGALRRRLDERVMRRVGPALPDAAPNMGKLPLVRWRRGLAFPRGPHRLSPRVEVAEEWGALLHFKYLDDFDAKTRHALERGQHFDGAAEYRRYDAEAARLMERGAAYAGSRRFRGVEDLEAVGLLRSSARLDAALARA